MGYPTTITKWSSTILRLAALAFLRLFPAHLSSIAFSFFAIYVPAFVSSYYADPQLEVVEERADVIVEETKETPAPRLTEDGVAVEPEPEVVLEEVTVNETVVVAEKDVEPWQVLLSGAPSRKHPIATIASFLINVLMIALVADSIYRIRLLHPVEDLSFVRLGYVSHTDAKFLIREPDQSKMPITLEIHIKDAQAPFDNPLWHTAGGVRWTANDTDYTAAITVPLIHSKQRRYEWRTSNNHSGEFIAAPKPGQMPELTDGKFTFLSTSCILPRFPYNPLDHPLSIPGVKHLAAKLPELKAQFMLFLGDFIYVDVPQQFHSTVNEYSMQYRQVYASPDWPSIGQNLSWIHVLDDHEIFNDWSSNSTGVYKNAVRPWHTYNADLNPPRAVAAGSKKAREGATWYEFVQGPASFFMMDTRSYRSSNNLPFEQEDKTMLGEEQLADLLAWLARPAGRGIRWKVVASSVPFTKNWPVNVKDTWGGFLVERRKILEAMWDAGAHGTSVIILSGDRHEFAATKFPPPPGSRWPESATAHEFSTSPLSQFSSPLGSYKQTDDEDVMMHYIPWGGSKFGAFTMENMGGQATLQYRLFINGKERWETVLLAAPETDTTRGSFFGKIKYT
ncbi:phoD-like phosphatase domain-containing protein [Sarocladium implicatum]|nr:phoD-like phosphatase domain-containing protein [Sarocladium implicatum]